MRERRDFLFTALFLALTLAIGGARDRYPVPEMVVELAALGLLVYFGWTRGLPRWRAGTRLPLVILGLVLLLPLLQLVPLPPWLWTSLPGRELATRITVLAGLDGIWRPLSLDPEATWRSFLFLLPGVAIFVAVGFCLPVAGRAKLVWIVIAFGLFGVMLGALQLASSDGSGVTPFRSSHTGYSVGLFVNRNQHATFLLIAMVLTGAMGSAVGNVRYARSVSAALILLLAVGVVATISRTGAATVPLALAIALGLLFHDRMTWKSVAAGAAGLALLTLIALQNAVIWRTLARYSNLDDARFRYWQDTLWALPQYWPAGTGFGTFATIYKTAESLENVGPNYVNQAHNDYIELALTGGLPALLVLALFFSFLVVAARKSVIVESDGRARILAIGALAGIAVILIHSGIEYPLRTLSLEALFGLLCGLLVGSGADQRGNISDHRRRRSVGSGRRTPWAGRAICVIVGAVLAWQVAVAAFERRTEATGREPAKSLLAPTSAKALRNAASARLLAGQWQPAAVLARRVLASAPLDSAALRTLALAREGEDRFDESFALMTAAGRLGWRDEITQWWLFESAVKSGELAVAVQRADALLRQNIVQPQLFVRLRELNRNPAATAELALRLAEKPDWRLRYLSRAGSLKRDQLEGHQRLLLLLAETSAPPTLDEVRAFANRLAADGDLKKAHDFWVRFAGADLPYDGGFENVRRNFARLSGGPFDWRRGGAGKGIDVTVGQPGAGSSQNALLIGTDGRDAGVAVAQLLMLPPGNYGVTADLRLDGAAARSPVVLTIRCVGVKTPAQQIGAHPFKAGADGWARISGSVVIPPAGCPAQDLGIVLVPAGGPLTEVWVDNVRIEKQAATGE
jgi:O-antigen ligase